VHPSIQKHGGHCNSLSGSLSMQRERTNQRHQLGRVPSALMHVESRIRSSMIKMVSMAIMCVCASQTFAAAGKTTGSFTVSASGAATYTIPIWAPKGPNGLQPNISLVYNSQSNNGYVGVGWSLSGLSSITRCDRTYAQDGVASPVALVASDALCLDGKRLRLTGGAQGSAGSTYQTEIADFSQVTAGGAAGNGPASFIVRRKDGLIYEYGSGGNSQVIATTTTTASAWMLDKITDKAGNTLTVTYTLETGVVVPDTISWTPVGAGATTYAYKMVFGYQNTTAAGSTYGFIAGTPVINPALLKTIAISYGSLVKEYFLTYTPSGTTARNLLTQVQECADTSQSNCFLPTNITYQNGAVGVGSAVNLTNRTGNFILNDVDFNGDGLNDLAWFDPANSGWIVSMATPTGYSTPYNTGFPAYATVGRIDNSGKDVWIYPIGTWYYYVWDVNHFVQHSAGFSLDSTNSYLKGQFVLSDVNGDGLADFVSFGSDRVLYLRLNTTQNGVVSFSAAVPTAVSGNYVMSTGEGHPKQLDMMGTGQHDVLAASSGGPQQNVVFHYSGGTLNMLPTISTGASPIAFADFNDDGCTDFLLLTSIQFSACNGSTGGSIPLPGTAKAVMDWDGDGRADVIVSDGSHLNVYISNGDGTFTGPTLISAVPYVSTTQYYGVRNATGDGQDALVTESGANITYYLHNSVGQLPDLLKNVSDGFGNSVSPSYGALSQSGSLYLNFTDATDAYQNYIGPKMVVSQATFSDPSATASTYQLTYSYYGAWLNLQGRGFMGYNDIGVMDSRNQVWSVLWYRRDFPFNGMQSGSWISQPNSASVWTSKTTNTFDDTVLDSTANNQRHFPHVTDSAVQSFELGGTLNGQLITTDDTTYAFDSNGNATNVVNTLTDNDPTSPYAGQQWTSTKATIFSAPDTGTNWCLTLPLKLTTTNTSPGSTITRTTAFNTTPDYTHCRINQVITEPTSSSYAVTRDLVYDAFGNLSSLTVTGAGMSPRVWTADWGTTGQFATTQRDPVSNSLGSSGYKTVKDYNYSFGLQSSEVVLSLDGTTRNAPPSSMSYDPFGRPLQKSNSDGTYVTFTYGDCPSVVGCPVGSHGLAVSRAIHNVDGTVQSDGTRWFDSVGRLVQFTDRLLSNGAYSSSGVRYDNLGRVRLQELPCGYSGTVSPCPFGVSLSYDVLGRLIQTQRPISASNSTLQTSLVSYAGRTTVTTDPYGRTHTELATVVGLLGASQDDAGYRQNFTYDAFGSLLAVADSSANTLFTASYDYGVDAFARDIIDTDLDTSSVAGQHRHFSYDALGELVTESDAKGQNFSFTYDGLSRQISRTEKLVDGTTDLATSWTWGSTAASHNVGQIAAATAGAYGEAYVYDGDARLSTRTITIPGDSTYAYDFAYDSNTGKLASLTYPTSTASYRLKLGYAYQNGLLLQVKDANAGTVFWTANATNARGQVNQETLGNGVVTNRTFDDVTGWMSSIASGVSGSTALQNESYLYDEMGNVIQRQNNNAGLTENFYYDDIYRLEHSTLNGTVNLQVGYGANGNITSRSDVAAGAAWTYDPTHKHAVAQAGSATNTFTYDGNGNAVSRNGVGITWTSYNHPSLINNSGTGEAIAFSYNHNHERWSAIYSSPAGMETTFFVGPLLEKVVSAGSSDFRHYIFAGNTKVAVYSRMTGGANTLRYLREDHQGSVANIINSDGSSYIRESFTAYGARRSTCTWSGPPTSGQLAKINAVSRHGYTWQNALGNMGLNDMNGRIQDAVTGRFLSADPYVDILSNPQSWNRYSYVGNNPLTYSDPTGFSKANLTHWTVGGGNLGDVTASDLSQVTEHIETIPVTGSRTDEQFEVPLSGSWDRVQERTTSDAQQQGGISTVTVSTDAPKPSTPPPPTISSGPLPEVVVAGTQPTEHSASLPVIIVMSAIDHLMAAKPYRDGRKKRGSRFKCIICTGPHEGRHGNYCPECDGKSRDPKGQIPPNPWSDDEDLPDLDKTPLPNLDDPAPMQIPQQPPLWLLLFEDLLAA